MALSLSNNRSRRSFFKNAVLSVGGSILIPKRLLATATQPVGSDKQPFRIVQITDSHVFNEKSKQHTGSMLASISRQERPDVIFHTGDVIMDAMKEEKQPVRDQWALWKTITAGVTVPIHYCIGNHDIWWNEQHSNDPLFGKVWMQQELGLPGRYYSFSKAGWQFIFLDSTQQDGNKGYTAAIDTEQMEWLTNLLLQIPSSTPVLIASHIPLLSSSVFEFAKCEENTWKVGASLMHGDSINLQKLFRKHTNIKGCISGHLHLMDHVNYDNIQYMGSGAVSGNWWSNSTFHQTTSGYSVLDLFRDGTIKREYKVYDWEKQT